MRSSSAAIRSCSASSFSIRASTCSMETRSRSTGVTSTRITRAPPASTRTVSSNAAPGRSGSRRTWMPAASRVSASRLTWARSL